MVLLFFFLVGNILGTIDSSVERLSVRHLTSKYVPPNKCSKNTKNAALHWMITSKGELNKLCLVCHFFSFFHPPLSIYHSPSTNGVMIWKVLCGSKLAQWAPHNCMASSLMDIPVLIAFAQCHKRNLLAVPLTSLRDWYWDQAFWLL